MPAVTALSTVPQASLCPTNAFLDLRFKTQCEVYKNVFIKTELVQKEK